MEEHLHFVPSLLTGGKRIRAVANEIWIGSPNSSFYDFVEDYAINLIGEQWWDEQEGTAAEDQNAMFKFADSYQRHKLQILLKSKETESPPLVYPSGPILFWLVLCYDLFCLKHKFSLPEPLNLVEKLKNKEAFQGARYEIAIAASLARAGCDINWINPKDSPSGVKTCELTATHRSTGISFAVEVKSKHRDGVLNQKGTFDSKAELKGVFRLLKEALKKNSQNLPLVIFIDLNLPSYLDDTNNQNAIQQIKEAVRKRKQLIAENQHLALIAFTNFPFHFGKADTAPPTTNHCFAKPAEVQRALAESIVKDIENSLLRYGLIPMVP